jgi:RNA polymerase sigma factor (sigma-70 family)
LRLGCTIRCRGAEVADEEITGEVADEEITGMPDATPCALSDHLAGLFGSGTCAGFSDGELLERFRGCRDEGGERAFESLVTRHGPMVLAICRNMLEDPSDVHDAFQAVFLVLARRAGAIRKTQSVGSWLYGVTVRVAARARATAIHRRTRERRILAAASAAALAGGSPEATPDDSAAQDDGAAVVHEEVVRLPERYRTPIVLCYFEGLTHDEAAARLSWPVGTVRSRLARARDQLRRRLTRRGVTAPCTIGPLAAWLIAGQSPATASAAIRATAAASRLPAHVPSSLARAAVRMAAGQPAAAGSLSAASVSLADGVLTTMKLKNLTVATGVVLTLGIGSGTGALVVRGSRAQDSPAATVATTKPAVKPAAGPETPKSPDVDPLLNDLIQAARRRLLAQKDYYRAGRIGIDRYIAASFDLARVELLAAKSEDERRAIRERHVKLAKEVENNEQAELKAGRSTESDMAEAHQARVQAEYDMKSGEKEDAEKAALLRRIGELERKVEQLQKGRDGSGRY